MLDFVWDPPDRENNPGKPWRWIILDSLIVAGITFISLLPQNRLPDINDFYIALRAFIYVFLLQIATERGLKPYLSKRRRKR